MKLNNKGFAITAVLYGLLILFVFLVGSYLTVLTAKKNRVDKITEEIEKSPAERTLDFLGLSEDKTLIPDFSTCSGNSCTYSKDYSTGHGDKTNGIYRSIDDL